MEGVAALTMPKTRSQAVMRSRSPSSRFKLPRMASASYGGQHPIPAPARPPRQPCRAARRWSHRALARCALRRRPGYLVPKSHFGGRSAKMCEARVAGPARQGPRRPVAVACESRQLAVHRHGFGHAFGERGAHWVRVGPLSPPGRGTTSHRQTKSDVSGHGPGRASATASRVQDWGRHCGRPRDEAFRKKRTISAEASGPAGSV